jgi:uncharacterized protein DUF4242
MMAAPSLPIVGHKPTERRDETMPRFVIEREITGAGDLSTQDLRAISQRSCSVLNEMGPQIQWVQSYVTDDKIYCVYLAPSEGMVREHARKGGFPANRVAEVRTVIDPTTAEA